MVSIASIRGGLPQKAAHRLQRRLPIRRRYPGRYRLSLRRIAQSGQTEDVRILVDFIKSSERGVIVRRGRDDSE